MVSVPKCKYAMHDHVLPLCFGSCILFVFYHSLYYVLYYILQYSVYIRVYVDLLQLWLCIISSNFKTAVISNGGLFNHFSSLWLTIHRSCFDKVTVNSTHSIWLHSAETFAMGIFHKYKSWYTYVFVLHFCDVFLVYRFTVLASRFCSYIPS